MADGSKADDRSDHGTKEEPGLAGHSGHEHHHTGKIGAPEHDPESLEHESMDKAVHGREVEHAPADEAIEPPKPPRGHLHDAHDAPARDAHAGHERHGGHEGHDTAVATTTAGEHVGHDITTMPEGRGHDDMASGHKGHGAHVDHAGHEQMFRQRFWVSLLLSIPVLLYSEMIQMWLGFTMPAFPGSQLIVPVLSVIIFAYGGLPFLQMAVPELRNRQPGMMTLISLAITVAFVYSLAAQFLLQGDTFFWELVTLIDIMLLGHWLEMRSVRQASGALDALAKLMPDTAERERPDGSTEEVPVSQLRGGDLLLVRPGASVPADGEVERGESDVNEAMITGESRPVKKEPGARVIAGTINGDGSLRVRVTATGEQTALAGIMRLVREAQASKSRTQVLADKAAAWLFYIALAVALLTAIAWTIAIGFNVEVIARVATVLVIACPHALGLAIPLVVAITTAKGANNGILVRDRLALERARLIDTIIFDKTGTLTEGRFGVVGMAVASDWTEERALALAAAIEGDSEHTIARGIRAAAEEKKLALPKVADFEALKGRGVRARSAGQTVYVGGPRLLESVNAKVPSDIASFEAAASGKGQSTVYLLSDDQVVAAFALADVIRPESARAVARLHEMGVQVAMLTGDAEAVARSVAEELGIDQYFAQVLPENKDQKVMELQRQGRKVAMVGDGVNDAPALTRADVGIAIGSGTDVAVQSAGIILVKSNPLDAVKVIELSRASYRKMIQNLVWATGYNVVALPLAAGILAPIGIILSPALGAVFMSVSTIVVALNAQLLRGLRLGESRAS
jgi:P-type Cu2+ transporter